MANLSENDVRRIATEIYNQLGTRWGVAKVPVHVHNGFDTNKVKFVGSLSDTPSTYAGSAGLVATVNAQENGLVFSTGATSGLTLETNTVLNGSQSVLNLFAGANITLTDNGAGKVTIDASGGSTSPASPDTSVQFNDGGSFGGDVNLTWDKNTVTLSLGQEDAFAIISTPAVLSTDTNGGNLFIQTAVGNGTGRGGNEYLIAGDGGDTGVGGQVQLSSGNGGGTSGAGGDFLISTGNGGGSDDSAGVFSITGGMGHGAGIGGIIEITSGDGGSDGDGGLVAITAGNAGATSGDGGTVTITAGTAPNGVGGEVHINGADNFIDIFAGTDAGGNQGAEVFVGGYTTDNGELFLSGGSRISGTGIGGAVNIQGGQSIGNTAGDVTITGGNRTGTSSDDDGNIVLGINNTVTSRNGNFLYIPTSAGTPTGTPPAHTGLVSLLYDTTNNKLYVYNGAWKSVTLT